MLHPYVWIRSSSAEPIWALYNSRRSEGVKKRLVRNKKITLRAAQDASWDIEKEDQLNEEIIDKPRKGIESVESKQRWRVNEWRLG